MRKGALAVLAAAAVFVFAAAFMSAADSAAAWGAKNQVKGGQLESNSSGAQDLLSGYDVGYTVLKAPWVGDDGKKTTIDVAVWYPASGPGGTMKYDFGENKVATRAALDAPARPGQYPLVAYAHGASAGGISSAFIAETLARKGYVVAGADLTDEFTQVRISGPVSMRFMQKAKMVRWMHEVRTLQEGKESKVYRKKLAYRPGQLKLSIDRVLEESSRKGSVLSGAVDADRIGLFGHSFGAWTVMMLSGADPGYRDKRVRATVALSGPVNEYVYNVASSNDVGSIHIPMMFMYGGKEVAQGRGDDRKYLYERANAPKFMLQIKDADHFTFSGGVKKESPDMDGYLSRDPRRAAITRYTLAFLDYYVKGDSSAKDSLSASDRYADIYEKDFGR